MKKLYTERVNLLEPNVYIGMQVELEGQILLDQLKTAMEEALKTNEATMSKIVLDENGEVYYEALSQSGCKILISDQSMEELILDNEKSTFAINQGELLRVFLIPDRENDKMAERIFFMAHHLLGDGKSIIYLIEDMMNALAGKELEYKPLILISPEDCPKASRPINFYYKYAHRYNKKWSKCERIFSWQDYYDIHQKYWESHESKLLTCKLDSKTTQCIIKAAKRKEVTVNSFIITAFLHASKKGKCVGIPISIRENNNRSLSNQTSGVSVTHRYKKRKSFDYNVKKVHTKVYKQINQPIRKYFVMHFMSIFTPTLIDAVLMNTHELFHNKVSESLAKVMGYKGGKTRDLGITNLGKIDIPKQYGDFLIKDIVFIPPVISYARHIVGVVTTEDTMNISYHFMGDAKRSEEEQFFNQGIQYLLEETKNSLIDNKCLT